MDLTVAVGLFGAVPHALGISIAMGQESHHQSLHLAVAIVSGLIATVSFKISLILMDCSRYKIIQSIRYLPLTQRVNGRFHPIFPDPMTNNRKIISIIDLRLNFIDETLFYSNFSGNVCQVLQGG